MSKLMFFDLETTGINSEKNGIHQISGQIVIEGEVKETFDFKVQPGADAEIDQAALDIAGVTKEQVMSYPPMKDVYSELVAMLAKYVDKFDKSDKLFLAGYNNVGFDNQFLRNFFLKNKDNYFGSWFWSNSIDVMVLASQYLIDRRVGMENFKLLSVAKAFDIAIDDEKLHDATYDIYLTKSIYDIINKPKNTIEMSDVNDYAFAKQIDLFKKEVLDKQETRVSEAKKIMDDPNYQWKDEAQKTTAKAKLDNMKWWLGFYQKHYDEARKLISQHERLVDSLSKWYDKWYADISNEGRQETEMMSMQADMLQEIFSEIYKTLQPLNLEGVKPPKALNL